MKIVKLMGGLGNQLFQYAFALRLSRETGDEVFLDTSCFPYEPAHNGYELGRVFRPRLTEAFPAAARRLAALPTGPLGRLRRKYFRPRSHVLDTKFSYQPELLSLEGDRYFEGYFQTEKYFLPVEAELREDLSFRTPLDEENRALLEALPKPRASVHVRRGDYLGHGNLDICGPKYYERAVARLRSEGFRSLAVFSDDPEYCRTAIDWGGLTTEVVDRNRGAESWQDLAMMAACEGHVIANSSFSWWGARLDPRLDRRVIAPSLWNRRELGSKDRFYRFSFADVVPAGWERIEP